MITAAAAIMVAVFGAFVLSGEVFLKLIGPATRPGCAVRQRGKPCVWRRRTWLSRMAAWDRSASA